MRAKLFNNCKTIIKSREDSNDRYHVATEMQDVSRKHSCDDKEEKVENEKVSRKFRLLIVILE
jgi:hypothetical protein